MSDIVIKVENLGKKYTIGHQAENGRYTALRDVLMLSAGNLWRKTKDFVQGKPVIQGNTMEEIWALKDVSFEIRRGEVVGIIGRNGAGKSTLLKVFSHITEPSVGRVTIKGRVASLLEVGTGFHPELTGRENIFLNGAILGMTKTEIKSKFDEIVWFAEIEKFLDTPVKRYSSGMKVRLAFSVASHLNPEILLIDEVLAVGDASFQQKCLGKMEDAANNERRTILFVSHNLSAVKRLCSRCLLIDKGGLVDDGKPHETIKTYLSSTLKNIGSRKWIKKDLKNQNTPFVPQKVFLKSSSGLTCDNIFCTESLSIEFYFLITAEIDNLRIGVKLFTALGEWVCLSYDKDDPKTYKQSVTPPGRYRSVCHFPPNFLNEGQYSINLYGSTAFGEIWSEQYALTFTAKIGDGVGSHWSSEEKREGVIRPLLKWENQRLSSDM